MRQKYKNNAGEKKTKVFFSFRQHTYFAVHGRNNAPTAESYSVEP